MKKDVKKFVLTAIMGALAFILMWFAFPVIIALPFLKVDFSDIPLLFATFLYGPLSGFGAMVIRSILHYIQTGGDLGYPIGDIASVLASSAWILPVYYLSKRHLPTGSRGQKRSRLRFWFALINIYGLGIISMTFVMSVLNYFIITPFYVKVMNFPIEAMGGYVLFGIIPFNLIKGLLISVVAHFFLARFLPVARRELQ